MRVSIRGGACRLSASCIIWDTIATFAAQCGHLPYEDIGPNQSMRAVAGEEWVTFDAPARPTRDDLAERIKGFGLNQTI